MESKKYQLNKEDGTKILKALLWSSLSAVIATLIVIMQQLEVPTEYMFLVPIVNAFLYSVSKFLSNN